MEQARIGRNGLYYVDNSLENWNMKDYLREWCKVSKQMDVATGYLEIGGLLDLDQEWQKLDKIRIILAPVINICREDNFFKLKLFKHFKFNLTKINK